MVKLAQVKSLGRKGPGVHPRAKQRLKKPKSITKLIKEADTVFSRKVRTSNKDGTVLTDMEGNEVNQCFTCLGIFLVKRLHCGHYLSRWYKSARWDFDNARPQCMMCNLYKKGDAVRFRQNLIKEIGEARVLAVEAKRNVSTKLTREYLENLIANLSEE